MHQSSFIEGKFHCVDREIVIAAYVVNCSWRSATPTMDANQSSEGFMCDQIG